MDTQLWCIRNTKLFEGLEADYIDKFKSSLNSRKYKKGEIVFDPDACCKVYIVNSGRLEIYHLTAEGKKVIIDVLKPGSIFGDLGEGISSDIFVEVIVDSEICSVDKDTFFKTVSTDPVSSERLMKQFYNRLIALESRTTSLALDNVEKRFLKLLLSLGELEEDGGKYKTDAFTHEQLAQMLGVSRQTITTLINELEREGVISRHKKQFIFNKKNLLDKLE